jgi:hypothetical protein
LPDYWNRDGISHHGDVKPAGQAAKSKLNKNPGPHLDLDEVIVIFRKSDVFENKN